MKNSFNLSFKFQLRKKTTILNITLLSLAFLIVLLLNTYSDSAINYMENDAYDSVFYKSLDVSVKKTDNREKVRTDIEKLEHVTLVSNYYAYSDILTSTDLANKKMPGEVEIYIANNKSLPKIVKGTNFPDEENNYLICPTYLYSVSDKNELKTISKKDAINMNNFLNKNINIPYNSNSNKHNHNITFKVVGLYEYDNYLDVNICFTEEHTLEKIIQDKYADDKTLDGEPFLSDQTNLFVQVDDVNNIQKVINELSNLGYESSPAAFIIPSYFENIKNTSQIVTTIILILTFLILLIISFKQYNEDAKTYQLLNYLGYRKKKINQISIISNIIQLCISLLISFLIFMIFYLIFKIVLSYYPYFFNEWEACINYKSIIYVFITALVATIISIIINLYHLNKGKK